MGIKSKTYRSRDKIDLSTKQKLNIRANDGSMIMVFILLLTFAAISFYVGQRSMQRKAIANLNSLKEYSNQSNLAGIELMDGLMHAGRLTFVNPFSGKFSFSNAVLNNQASLQPARALSTYQLRSNPGMIESIAGCDGHTGPTNTPATGPDAQVVVSNDGSFQEAVKGTDGCYWGPRPDIEYVELPGNAPPNPNLPNGADDPYNNPNKMNAFADRIDLDFDPRLVGIITTMPSPEELGRAIHSSGGGILMFLKDAHGGSSHLPFGYKTRLKMTEYGNKELSVLCTSRLLPVGTYRGENAQFEHCEPMDPKTAGSAFIDQIEKGYGLTQIVIEFITGSPVSDDMRAHVHAKTYYWYKHTSSSQPKIKVADQKAVINIPSSYFPDDDVTAAPVPSEPDVDELIEIYEEEDLFDPPTSNPNHPGFDGSPPEWTTDYIPDPGDDPNTSTFIPDMPTIYEQVEPGCPDPNDEDNCGIWQHFVPTINRVTGAAQLTFCPTMPSCGPVCKEYCVPICVEHDAFGDCTKEECDMKYMCCTQYSAKSGCREKGCFSLNTKLTLFDGSEKNFEELQLGDELLNPVRRTAMKVKEIKAGREPKFATYKIGYGKHEVHFSSLHPIPVISRGIKMIKMAKLVEKSDRILGESGIYHRITTLERVPPNHDQFVYNVVLDTDSEHPADHMILADGIISGDLWLQNKMSDDQQYKLNVDIQAFMRHKAELVRLQRPLEPAPSKRHSRADFDFGFFE